LDAGHVNQGILALNIAYLAVERGDAAAAEQMYRRAVDAGSVTATRKLGDILSRRGDLDGAEALYRRGQELGDQYSSRQYARLTEERALLHNEDDAAPGPDADPSVSVVPETGDGD
jgi:TPR repeat protein